MGGRRVNRSADGGAGIRRLAAVLLVPLMLATIVGLVAMWPSGEHGGDQTQPPMVPAQVVEVMPEACPEGTDEDVNGCGRALVRLEQGDGHGSAAGDEVEVRLPSGPGAPRIVAGDDVVVLATTSPDGVIHSVVDHQRARGMWVLAAAFALTVIAFGRLRGLTALVGLAFTFAMLVMFVVPAILSGEPPVLVALVGSAAIMLVVLYLTHGPSTSTTVALLGTLGSLVVTGLLAWLSVEALHLSGITDDIATAVVTTHGVNMQGLLLAGIVIGSLGVLDDVTITQTATVDEVGRANPTYGFRQLYRAGSRVGRSHIASVINTIILAYAGSSLPLLILVVANDSPLGSVLTDQIIAQEIVRSAVATLGLIAAVPLTTALAAFVRARTDLGSDHSHSH